MFYLPSKITSLIGGAGKLKPVGLFYRLGNSKDFRRFKENLCWLSESQPDSPRVKSLFLVTWEQVRILDQ